MTEPQHETPVRRIADLDTYWLLVAVYGPASSASRYVQSSEESATPNARPATVSLVYAYTAQGRLRVLVDVVAVGPKTPYAIVYPGTLHPTHLGYGVAVANGRGILEP